MSFESIPDHRSRISSIALADPWTKATGLIVAVLLVRLLYLAWLCPYQLLGDEAYYWEQARHLDLSYDEKGPLLAWMIAGCCHLFGDNEFAVRLPVAISAALAAYGVGIVTMQYARDRDAERTALLAVVIFLLLPAFHANAQICTQDGPLIFLWIVLTAIGLRLTRLLDAQRPTWSTSMLLWIVLGIGALLKQSVLLFLLGFPLYLLIARPKQFPWRRIAIEQLIGIVLFFLITSPMLVWDARHGWPMLAHTLGHLGAGGDQAGRSDSGNLFIWVGNTVGGIIGAFGPACILLMVWACLRTRQWRASDAGRWRGSTWLMCAAIPSTAFFVLLSFIKPVVPSWPLPALVSLVPLVADLAREELDNFGEKITAWRRRQAHARIDEAPSRKPETLFHQLWVVLVAYGLIGCLILSFPNFLKFLPLIGPRIEHSVLKRFTGHREAAADLAAQLTTIRTPDSRPAVIVTRHYMQAALYAFYLPNHPSVCTAGKYLGKRSTTFDTWPDTDLSRPEFRGRTLLLDGQGDVTWERALKFSRLEPIAGARYFLATDFQGPRSDHPTFNTQ